MAGTPAFTDASQRTGPPDHLVLKANRACIHKSHRTVANNEALLNGFKSIHLHRYTPRSGVEGGKRAKEPISQFLPEEPYYILSQLLPQGLAPNQPVSRCKL